MFSFLLSLYHKGDSFRRNEEKFILGVRLFVDSGIVGSVFIVKWRRY